MAVKKRRGKVLNQVQGYRIRKVIDGDKITKKYGVYAGKNPVNVEKGFDTYDEAMDLAKKIVSGEVEAEVIKRRK